MMTRDGGAKMIRRKQYFVATKYQLKYIAIILLFMMLTVVICVFTVYYSGTAIFAEKLADVYPQSRIVPLINKVNFRIFFNIMLVIPVVGVISIFLSHKLAGPLIRVERYLIEIAAGKLTAHIKLRKGDELVSLAERVNELTESLRGTIGNLRGSLGKIAAEIDRVKALADSKPANIAEIDSMIERIEGQIRTFNSELDRFIT